MAPVLDCSTNAATRFWTVSEGRNAITASGVVPAAIKSIISSYDFAALIVVQLLQHSAEFGPGKFGQLCRLKINNLRTVLVPKVQRD